MRRCVLLFAQAPGRDARAKRLRRGRALYTALAQKTARAALALPGVELVVAGVAPAGVRPHHRLPQRGLGFGRRLEAAFEDARALGYRSIVAVPQDVPLLGSAQLRRAFAALEQASMVLGPSPDGGVYLLGLGAGAALSLLRAVRWCSAHVAADLALGTGGAICLEPLADLDHRRELSRLCAAGAGDPALRRLIAALCARPTALPSPRRRHPDLGSARSARAPPP